MNQQMLLFFPSMPAKTILRYTDIIPHLCFKKDCHQTGDI